MQVVTLALVVAAVVIVGLTVLYVMERHKVALAENLYERAMRLVDSANLRTANLNEAMSVQRQELEESADRAAVKATEWQAQAQVLAAQNTRLLDDLAAARLQLGDTADKILLAFTGGPADDTTTPDPVPTEEDIAEQLQQAFLDTDWTDTDSYVGTGQAHLPPPWVADIPAVEEREA